LRLVSNIRYDLLLFKDIEAAIEKGRKYNPDDFNPYYLLQNPWV
jgi:hypothetical protein